MSSRRSRAIRIMRYAPSAALALCSLVVCVACETPQSRAGSDSRTELLRGNGRAATEIFRRQELRWIDQSRRSGEPLLNSASTAFALLDFAEVALDAGSYEDVDRILRDYPDRISAPGVSQRDKLRYVSRRQLVRAILLSHRGDDESAYREAKDALDFLRKGARELNITALDRRAVLDDETKILLWLVRYSGVLGRLSESRSHLQDLNDVAQTAGSGPLHRQRVYDGEAAFHVFNGTYRQALEALDASWSLIPQPAREAGWIRWRLTGRLLPHPERLVVQRLFDAILHRLQMGFVVKTICLHV